MAKKQPEEQPLPDGVSKTKLSAAYKQCKNEACGLWVRGLPTKVCPACKHEFPPPPEKKSKAKTTTTEGSGGSASEKFNLVYDALAGLDTEKIEQILNLADKIGASEFRAIVETINRIKCPK